MTPRLRPFARKSSASLLFVTVFLFMTQAVSAQPDNAEDRRRVLIERMKKKIDQASSPVGDWIFTRLEVVTNAALAGGGAHASYELKSLLVRGTFTVSDDGSIKGNGTARRSAVGGRERSAPSRRCPGRIFGSMPRHWPLSLALHVWRR